MFPNVQGISGVEEVEAGVEAADLARGGGLRLVWAVG